MYPSAPPDAYNKFDTRAPPTAPPPATYQQHGIDMNPARPAGAGLRRWSTGLFHCMDDPGNCESFLSLLLLPIAEQRLRMVIQTYLQLLIHFFAPRRSGLITCICPCITFGQVADIVDKGSCCKSSFLLSACSCVSKSLEDIDGFDY
jgi:hypothetical protein